MLVPSETPAPTPEYTALEPRQGESGLDPLTRIGDEIAREFGGDEKKDPSRKDKKLPKQLAALVALRAQGFDNKEIADKLGVSQQKLRALVAKARRDYGWSDLGDKIAHHAVPLAVDNVIKHLDHEGSAAGVIKGDSIMTREVLKGVGVFKSHSAVKQESKSEQTNILRVEIALPELPPGVQGLALTEGSILSTPRRALVSRTDPAPAATVINVQPSEVSHG